MIARPRVFISYSTHDDVGQRFANELRNVLQERNYTDVFYWDHSRQDILGAPLWGEAGIPMEIKNRDVMIVLCTTTTAASLGVEREYCIALRYKKLIIPLRHGDAAIPSGLIELYASFTEQDYTTVFTIIAESLPANYRRHCDRLERNRAILAATQVISNVNVEPEPQVGEVGPN